MSIDSEIGRRLTMFASTGHKVTVIMKSKRIKPFIATIKDFTFDGTDDVVVFQRCTESVFPDDSDNSKNESYTTYIKNVKEVSLAE